MQPPDDTGPGYFDVGSCDIEAFAALTARTTDPASVPHARSVEHGIPIYEADALVPAGSDHSARRTVMAEWARVLRDGAGVLVIRNACPDHAAIDAASEVFAAIIEDERAAGGQGADHFAAAGHNDRIWNALQKLCLRAPDTFLRYHACPAIDMVCEAWLGPGYQVTAQVNLVRPGGAAQQAHRDYHLGFQTAEAAARFPAHAHDLSPVLTLQGGIAHCDVPVEGGPTKLLPFSQLYRAGYLACHRSDFAAHFEAHCVQLPLARGDALFFNPALFHAAGDNRSKSIQRLVNLLQVSSPFGRAMETVDRAAMCRALYPRLLAAMAEGRLSEDGRDAVIAASAEGYAFPTNLDTDPPVGGLAPESQQGLLRRALAEGWTPEAFEAGLAAQAGKRRA